MFFGLIQQEEQRNSMAIFQEEAARVDEVIVTH